MPGKRSIKLPSYLLLTTFLVVLFPARSMAWGKKGHQVIARIAMARLSTSARIAIADLLPGETLESVSYWADEIRAQKPDTRSWHFVSISPKNNSYSRSDCPQEETCIIAAISQQVAILKDTSKPMDQRAEALKFLVNLIGDLHQPFHVTSNDDPPDQGASRVRVFSLAGPLTNLHEIWDTDLVEAALKSSKSIEDYANQLSRKYAGSTPAQNSVSTKGQSVFFSTRGSSTDWALESHRLAWGAYYFTRADGTAEFMVSDAQRSWKLDQVYYDKNMPVAEVQLVRAGVRLAKVLNDVFSVKATY